MLIRPENPEVISLNRRLQSFPINPPRIRASTFRNRAGIAMRLRTFTRYDSSPGAGLQGWLGGALTRDLWRKFDARRIELRETAQVEGQLHLLLIR